MHGRIRGKVNKKHRIVTIYKSVEFGYGFIFNTSHNNQIKFGGCGWKSKGGIVIALKKISRDLNFEFQYKWEV